MSTSLLPEFFDEGERVWEEEYPGLSSEEDDEDAFFVIPDWVDNGRYGSASPDAYDHALDYYSPSYV